MRPVRCVTFGEAMIEVSGGMGAPARLGFGGDTLNTALYLARLGVDTAFATSLGTDPWSLSMRQAWAAEGIDLSLVLSDSERVPGLYAIKTTEGGERSFTYWRERSAARAIFDHPELDRVLEAMVSADVLYLSGISLSLYNPVARVRLVDCARAARARGGRVVFDPNYRARGWPDPMTASGAMTAIAPHVDVVLATFEDEQLRSGVHDAAAAAAIWLAAGATEVVVKQGAAGALVVTGEKATEVPSDRVSRPVDTTGAGDSFNAAYLHARLGGLDPVTAARAGHRLAAHVIAHPGAIIPASAMPDRQRVSA